MKHVRMALLFALAVTASAQTNTSPDLATPLIEQGRKIVGKKAVQTGNWNAQEYRSLQDSLSTKDPLLMTDAEVSFCILSAMFATNANQNRQEQLQAKMKAIADSAHPKKEQAGAKYMALFGKKAEVNAMIDTLSPSDLMLRSAKQAADRLGEQKILTNAFQRAVGEGASSQFYQRWFLERLGTMTPEDREKAIRRELRKLKDKYGDGTTLAEPTAEAWVRALRVKRTLTEMEVAP